MELARHLLFGIEPDIKYIYQSFVKCWILVNYYTMMLQHLEVISYKQQAEHTGLLFNPKDGGNRFFPHVYKLLLGCTA
jgi:hypothetical protein